MLLCRFHRAGYIHNHIILQQQEFAIFFYNLAFCVSFLIVLKVFSTIWNKSGERGYSSLLPVLDKKFNIYHKV